jgi:hypothetical protein
VHRWDIIDLVNMNVEEMCSEIMGGFNWLKVALTQHFCEDNNAFMDS